MRARRLDPASPEPDLVLVHAPLWLAGRGQPARAGDVDTAQVDRRRAIVARHPDGRPAQQVHGAGSFVPQRGVVGRERRRPVAALPIGEQAAQQSPVVLGDQEAAAIGADDPSPPSREAAIRAEVEALAPRGGVHEAGERVQVRTRRHRRARWSPALPRHGCVAGSTSTCQPAGRRRRPRAAAPARADGVRAGSPRSAGSRPSPGRCRSRGRRRARDRRPGCWHLDRAASRRARPLGRPRPPVGRRPRSDRVARRPRRPATAAGRGSGPGRRVHRRSARRMAASPGSGDARPRPNPGAGAHRVGRRSRHPSPAVPRSAPRSPGSRVALGPLDPAHALRPPGHRHPQPCGRRRPRRGRAG